MLVGQHLQERIVKVERLLLPPDVLIVELIGRTVPECPMKIHGNSRLGEVKSMGEVDGESLVQDDSRRSCEAIASKKSCGMPEIMSLDQNIYVREDSSIKATIESLGEIGTV
jgi:hypothetical protein